jgi:hypothetical protein
MELSSQPNRVMREFCSRRDELPDLTTASVTSEFTENDGFNQRSGW